MLRSPAGAFVTVLGLALALAPSAAAKAPFEGEDKDLVRLLGQVVTEVSGGAIFNCIDAITKDVPYHYRLMGTPTHDLFVEKYGSVFTDRLGLPSHVVHFDEGGSLLPGQGGDNIIGVLPGKDPSKWVVIGGHYDTRELTVGGGALDNTSGICTVLEIAGSFVDLGLQPEATLVFAWWDGEEWGLYGARAFVEDHSATKQLLGLDASQPVDMLAAVSFDMVGLNYPAMNTWVQYGDPTTILETAVLNVRTSPVEKFTFCRDYGCYDEGAYSEGQLTNFTHYRALVEEVAYAFLGFPDQYVWVYDDEYGRSDHVPFIARGVPGMRVQGSHDEEYPHYHMPTDTLAALTLLAGSETHLRAGFDKAADVGAAVMAYVAMKGHVGTLGTNTDGPSMPAEEPEAGSTPGFELVLVLGAVAWASAVRRRR